VNAETSSSRGHGGRPAVAVVVAHPDDETLWAGGTILMNPAWRPVVVSLCRGSDPDRAPKFRRAIERLGASGRMADLDDGPEQRPLPEREVQEAIMDLLPGGRFEIVFAHGLRGEYTRHLRHEEAARGVLALWEAGRLSAGELRMFAYEDGGGQYLPRPMEGADIEVPLPERIWRRKREIITELYGFAPESFEARTSPRREAFWRFGSPEEVHRRMGQLGGDGSR